MRVDGDEIPACNKRHEKADILLRTQSTQESYCSTSFHVPVLILSTLRYYVHECVALAARLLTLGWVYGEISPVILIVGPDPWGRFSILILQTIIKRLFLFILSSSFYFLSILHTAQYTQQNARLNLQIYRTLRRSLSLLYNHHHLYNITPSLLLRRPSRRRPRPPRSLPHWPPLPLSHLFLQQSQSRRQDPVKYVFFSLVITVEAVEQFDSGVEAGVVTV